MIITSVLQTCCAVLFEVEGTNVYLRDRYAVTSVWRKELHAASGRYLPDSHRTLDASRRKHRCVLPRSSPPYLSSSVLTLSLRLLSQDLSLVWCLAMGVLLSLDDSVSSFHTVSPSLC